MPLAGAGPGSGKTGETKDCIRIFKSLKSTWLPSNSGPSRQAKTVALPTLTRHEPQIPVPSSITGFRMTRVLISRTWAIATTARIISTDLKGPGHDQERKDSILSAGQHSGSEMLDWHFQKCAEYGFAGWWIWSYQDQKALNQRQGIRTLDGHWKPDLLQAIKGQKPTPPR